MLSKNKHLLFSITLLFLLIAPQLLFAQYPNSPNDIEKVIENFRDWFGRIIAVLGVIVILYAAFLYMTAGGDEEKIATAKKILIAGVIGVALAIIAYGIIGLVASFLTI